MINFLKYIINKTNMIWNKKILKAEFEEKNFLEKKSTLLDLLSSIPQDNQKVIDLIEIVNVITNDDIEWLTEVFDIIIEALETVENKSISEVEQTLEKAKLALLEVKKQEEKERSEIDLEAILAKLN